MDLGSTRFILRCGTEERRVEPGKLREAIDELTKTGSGKVISARVFGVVKG